MNKAFTMIELIFAIVIIGILSTIAVPKFTSIRNDAEISNIATSISTAISDISSYASRKEQLSDNLEIMTDALDVDSASSATGYIKMKGKNCLQFDVDKNKNSLKIMKLTGCEKVFKNKNIEKLLTYNYTCPLNTDEFNTTDTAKGCATAGQVIEENINSKSEIEMFFKKEKILPW